MNGNAELLNFILKNSQMGVITIGQLLGISEDETFKIYLREQYKGYKRICKTAKKLLNSNFVEEKGISRYEKFTTYMMIRMKTMCNKKSSHIAAMMIIGSDMGIIDSIQKQHRYKDAEGEILELMRELQQFEEANIENLKRFLYSRSEECECCN